MKGNIHSHSPYFPHCRGIFGAPAAFVGASSSAKKRRSNTSFAMAYPITLSPTLAKPHRCMRGERGACQFVDRDACRRRPFAKCRRGSSGWRFQRCTEGGRLSVMWRAGMEGLRRSQRFLLTLPMFPSRFRRRFTTHQTLLGFWIVRGERGDSEKRAE